MLFNLSSESKKISVFFERKLVKDVFIAYMEEQDDAPVRNRCHQKRLRRDMVTRGTSVSCAFCHVGALCGCSTCTVKSSNFFYKSGKLASERISLGFK